MNTRRRQIPPPSPSEQQAAIRAKFTRLAAIKKELNQMKNLYAEYDGLMRELLPLFIEGTPERFILNREYRLGNKTYRFTPMFYDEAKSQLKAKVWKSTAHESGTIE
jgi:hypothetical protein